MADYVLTSGDVLTDEMIEEMTSYYDRGEFPPGEVTVEYGTGKPRHSNEGSEVISIKVAPAVKVRLANMAKEQGLSMSALARQIITAALI